jgi:glycyl-tRNA synthetase
MQTLLENGRGLDVRAAIAAASDLQPITVTAEAKSLAFDFLARRLEQLLVDSGISVEVARAVLNQRSNDPLLAQQTAKDLQAGPLCMFLMG